MRTKRKSVLMILPAVAACFWQVHATRAQDLLLPPLPSAGATIPLERVASPSPAAPAALPPLYQAASPQSNGGAIVPSAQSGLPDPSAIARLRNPFQWDSGPEERNGLLGRINAPRKGAVASPLSPQSGVAPYPGPAPGSSAATGTVPGTGNAPAPPTSPGAPGAAPTPGPSPAAAAAAAAAEAGPGFGGGLAAAQELFPMIGDMSPYRLNSTGVHFAASQPKPGELPGTSVPPPPPPGNRAGSLFYPSIRLFKISENMSPRPQDRVFFSFHNYYNVNQDINRDFGVPVKNITASRYFLGFEKTFNEGNGSFGIRLPIDNVAGTSTLPNFKTPGSTATGNLSVFAKYILEQNKVTGSLVSVGFAVTPPTGPGRFAGAPWTFGLNTISFQPFMGYIWNNGNFYIHGFSALDFPVSTNDVSLMFNDIGCGYYLMRSNDPTRLITAIAPTFEVHVTTPLNHRKWYNPFDLAGTADSVNLTYGVGVELKRRALLSTALITPLTSPRPFSAELAVMLNIYYGRTRSNRIAMTPPPLF